MGKYFQGWDVFERTGFDTRCGNNGVIDSGFGKEDNLNSIDCYKKFRTGHSLKLR